MISINIHDGSTHEFQVPTSTMGFQIQMIWENVPSLIFTSLEIMAWESLNSNTQRCDASARPVACPPISLIWSMGILWEGDINNDTPNAHNLSAPFLKYSWNKMAKLQYIYIYIFYHTLSLEQIDSEGEIMWNHVLPSQEILPSDKRLHNSMEHRHVFNLKAHLVGGLNPSEKY